MAAFVFFMNLLAAVFAFVFIVEISALIIGCFILILECVKRRARK